MSESDAFDAVAYTPSRTSSNTKSVSTLKDARDDAYLEVPAAAAFLDVLSHPHFVLGGPLVVEVRAPSADHDGWRARTKVREMSLVAS